MKNNKAYYYDADSLLRTEDFTKALIGNNEKLIKWLSDIDIDNLVKIEIDDDATFGEIAAQALKDYIDGGEEYELNELYYVYCYPAIFDSDKKFLGFGKACFEYSINYTGKEMYRFDKPEGDHE